VASLGSDQLFLNMLSQDALDLLEKVRELSLNLDQLLEHQRALVALFTVKGNYSLANKNCAEINQNC